MHKLAKISSSLIILLGSIGILSGCTRTYHSTPKLIQGQYYLNTAKENSHMPILYHFTKHHMTTQIIPQDEKELARTAIKTQELGIYQQGLRNATTGKLGTRKTRILKSKNMLKKFRNDFKSKNSKHYKALDKNLLQYKDTDIKDIKYLHKCYYIRGNITQPQYYVNKKKQLKVKNSKFKDYTITKFFIKGRKLYSFHTIKNKTKKFKLKHISTNRAKQLIQEK